MVVFPWGDATHCAWVESADKVACNSAEGACGDGAAAAFAGASASLVGWASRGRLDKVTELLALRADPRASDEGGGSALHAAMRWSLQGTCNPSPNGL